MITRTVTIINKLGLHARPSALLAKTASVYRSSITLRHGTREVDAKSIMGLITMALPQGTTLTLKTDGRDEEDAMAHIAELFETRFGESE